MNNKYYKIFVSSLLIIVSFLVVFMVHVKGMTTFDPGKEYAYEISLIYHNKDKSNSEEVKLGQSILIYPQGFLNSGGKLVSGGYPSDENQFLSGGHNLYQIVNFDKNDPLGEKNKTNDVYYSELYMPYVSNSLKESSDSVKITIEEHVKIDIHTARTLNQAFGTPMKVDEDGDFVVTFDKKNNNIMSRAALYEADKCFIGLDGALGSSGGYLTRTLLSKSDGLKATRFTGRTGFIAYKASFYSNYVETVFDQTKIFSSAKRTGALANSTLINKYGNNKVFMDDDNPSQLTEYQFSEYYNTRYSKSIPKSTFYGSEFLERYIRDNFPKKPSTIEKFNVKYFDNDIRHLYIKVQKMMVIEGPVKSKERIFLNNIVVNQKDDNALAAKDFERTVSCSVYRSTTYAKCTGVDDGVTKKERCNTSGNIYEVGKCEENCKNKKNYGPESEVLMYGETPKICYSGNRNLEPNSKITYNPESNYYFSGGNLVFHLGCGIKNIYTIYGTRVKKDKYLTPVRFSIKFSFDNKEQAYSFSDSCSDSKTKHAERDDNNVVIKPERYQYYIGPNLQEALVGTSGGNKWNLSNCGSSAGTNHNYGVKYYYFPDPPCDPTTDATCSPCKNLCSYSAGRSGSDDYLRCSENYCDTQIDANLKGNFVDRKKECIVNSCGYQPKVDKCGLDSRSPNVNIKEKLIKVKDSECGVITKNSVNSIFQIQGGQEQKIPVDTNVKDLVSAKKTCVSDVKSGITFDTKNYINIDCVENVSSNINTTVKNSLKPGEQFSYELVVNVLKNCEMYFDINEWKLDYASIPSNDPALRRRRLMYVYDVYNKSHDKRLSVNPDYDHRVFGEEGFGIIDEAQTRINVSNNAVSKHTQVINNIVENNKFNKNGVITEKSYTYPAARTSSSNLTMYKISNNSIEPLSVRNFFTTDKITYTFQNAKVCVDIDGNLYYSETCRETNKPGIPSYFVSYNATKSKDFTATNSKFHGIDYGYSNSNFFSHYEINDSCKYSVPDTPEELYGCSITIQSSNSGSGRCYNSLDSGDYNIVVTPWVKNRSTKDFSISSNITLLRNGVTYRTNLPSGYAFNAGTLTSAEYNAVASVDFGNGVVKSCSRDFIVTSPDCEVRRESPTSSTFYIALTNSAPISACFMRTFRPNMINKFERMDYRNCRMTVDLSDGMQVHGMIITNGGVSKICRAYCDDSRANCVTGENVNFKPGNFDEVNEYCKSSFENDQNGFSNKEECIRTCSVCPPHPYNDTIDPVFSDIDKAKLFCKSATDYGFPNESSCLNSCFWQEPCKDGNCPKYTFRQISNLDPFPYSIISIKQVPTANIRPIGSNWVGLEHYITNDEKDATSVTGPNSVFGNVEYVVDLNFVDMKKIREKNKDIYHKYDSRVNVREQDKGKKNVPYYSKFIHEDADVSGLFIKTPLK